MLSVVVMLLLGGAKVQVDTTGVTLVRGQDGWGQVCPISPTQAWTAQHVTTERTVLGDDKSLPMIFAAPDGQQGTVEQVYYDKRRDLALVEAVMGTFPVYYKLATEAPKKGDRVTLVGLDDDYLPKRAVQRIRSLPAGSLVYDGSPGPGSSGSCVLNEAGELIGINESARSRGDNWFRGMGWALYGPWSEVPERFKAGVALTLPPPALFIEAFELRPLTPSQPASPPE